MHRKAVRVGLAVYDDRLDAELAAGANDAKRDLAAIGDEDLIEGHRAPPQAASRQTRSPPELQGGSVSRARRGRSTDRTRRMRSRPPRARAAWRRPTVLPTRPVSPAMTGNPPHVRAPAHP